MARLNETVRRGVALSLRRRGRQLALAALAAILVATAVIAVTSAGAAPRDSGVRGRVWLGPPVPVQRVGGPANERPYAATIQVLRAGSERVVATTPSGNDGYFAVNLAPGRYVLQGVSPGRFGLPYALPVSVQVVAHRFTTSVVSFDTGIR